LVRQRFGADCNTDISGFNDVLKKPLRGFKNSRIAQRLIFFLKARFTAEKPENFHAVPSTRVFFIKSRILLDPTFSDSQNFN